VIVLAVSGQFLMAASGPIPKDRQQKSPSSAMAALFHR
jgi:hypothetical protein